MSPLIRLLLESLLASKQDIDKNRPASEPIKGEPATEKPSQFADACPVSDEAKSRWHETFAHGGPGEPSPDEQVPAHVKAAQAYLDLMVNLSRCSNDSDIAKSFAFRILRNYFSSYLSTSERYELTLDEIKKLEVKKGE